MVQLHIFLTNTGQRDTLVELIFTLFNALLIGDAYASLFQFNGQGNPNPESLVKPMASLSRNSLLVKIVLLWFISMATTSAWFFTDGEGASERTDDFVKINLLE